MLYTNNDIKINYEVIGEGKPVLCIHGLSCDMNLMKGCMEPIFEEVSNYKRIYIDLPGMGHSAAPIDMATSDNILKELIIFINEIVKEDFILIGESYGGYLSLGLMSQMGNMIKKTILICPMIKADITERNLPEKDIIEFDYDFLNNLEEGERNSFCYYAIIANKKTYDRYVKEILSGLKRVDSNFMNRLSENYAYTFDIKRLLEIHNYQIPTLILAGKQDICVGYKDLYEILGFLPRSSYHLIDKAGHNLQIDQPEIFNVIVKNWLLTVK